MDFSQHAPVDRLLDLGFSQYEAQAYVGLLGREPMTGYSLANLTGIPQPKVYETLRRLARKGAAIQVGGDPALFVALPPDRLLAQLDSDFRQRLAQAREELDRPSPPGAGGFRVLRSMTDWPAIERAAVSMLDAAGRHYYVSMNADRQESLAAAIARADERGVRGDILTFGEAGDALGNARVIRHLSTDGVVYRHHQARHLAVVADGSRVLWALAADGSAWEAATADDGLIAAVVKGYIRHDMYVQQITSDFGPLLLDKYGPGLNALVEPAQRAPGPAGPQPADVLRAAAGGQPRRRRNRTA